MRWLLAPLATAALGCAIPAYRSMAGREDIDAIRSVGCLDVGLAVRPPVRDEDAALLVLRVGNRCMRPVRFDLRAATLVGTVDGQLTAATLVDPRDEIHAVHVEPGAQGLEKIRVAAPGRLEGLCVDLSRTALAEPGHAPNAQACFTFGAAGWRPR